MRVLCIDAEGRVFKCTHGSISINDCANTRQTTLKQGKGVQYLVVSISNMNELNQLLFENMRKAMKPLPRSNWFSSPMLHKSADRIASVIFIQKSFRLGLDR